MYPRIIQGLVTISLLFFFISNSFAQKANNYEADWKEIADFEKENLPKSSLEASQKLYDKIKKDKTNPVQTAQQIKALMYINKYQIQLEEEGLVKAIDRFQQEAEEAEGATKAVLQSLVAELYNDYLNQNLYKFTNRTTTEDFKLEDIRTWDIDKITQKSYELYWASVQNDAIKKIDLATFDAILVQGSNTQNLRPTLYDFLVHRALDFFMSEKTYLTQPAYKFYVDQAADFASPIDFSKRKLKAKDSLSSSFQALLLFQKAFAFHAKDKDPKALIDLDLKRLDFVYSKSVLENKDKLYLDYLVALYSQYEDNEASTEVAHKIALHYSNEGSKYKPGTKNYRWDRKKAYLICEKAIKAHPESYGADLCKLLKLSIESKRLSISTEKVNPIDQSMLARVVYQNLDKIYLKAIPISEKDFLTFNSKYGKEKIKFANNLSGAFRWNLTLKNEGDYHQHAMEFEIPKLKAGRYILIASPLESFQYNDNANSYSSFYVSNLALISRQQNALSEAYVVDRTSGQPLQGVTADFYVSKYNSLLRQYESVKIHTSISDKDGFIQFKYFDSKHSYYSIKLTYKDDIFYNDDSYYNYEPPYIEEREVTHFFLDRAIYRPGQTVYFKGLVLNALTNGKNPKLVPNSKRTVTFYDANHQKVSELELTTNEYGSFNGSFTAPSSGLMGQMFLNDKNSLGYKYFRVEEYKRPKFEVTALPITVSFKIDDSVKVEGHAKAYAGNNIDGAKVQYRIVRQTKFPYWNWRWGWHDPYGSGEQEIENGTTTTDSEGKYIIPFKAIADLSIPKNQNPEFTYTVHATVTDITGETHSTQSTVRVGYIALDVSITSPSLIDRENFESFKINTQNLNNEFEPAQGNIRIEQLQTPEQVFKKRFWPKPDYYTWDEASFKKKFPEYAFGNEDEQNHWAVVKTALETSFDTEKDKNLNIEDLKDWPQGAYRMVLTTKDKYGQIIEVTKNFTLFSSKEKTTPLNEALFVAKSDFYNTEPGSSVQLDFGSHYQGAHILYEIEHDNKIIAREWIETKGRKTVRIPVKEKHRGNLHVHFTSIKDGRFHTNGGTIYVPWSNKDLKIEYATFRNKLYPGQEEEWKIKISGNKGEKVAAEILAGMYDASLDAFAANYWGFNVHPSNYRSLALNAGNSFASTYSQSIQDQWNQTFYPQERSYPSLNWNGFPVYGSYYGGGVYHLSDLSEAPVYYSSIAASPSNPVLRADGIISRDFADDANAVTYLWSNNSDAKSSKEQKTTSNAANSPEEDFGDVQIRTNLKETVFFYPDLMCDKEGNVIIKFTMNEALTKWKFMLMGHTKDLESVIETKEIVTQKDLMVMPNAPRFFREKDEIYFTAKVSNLTEKDMKGSAQLLLFDAISMKPIDAEFGNAKATRSFDAKAGQSAPLVWKLKIPDGWTTAVAHRVVAKSGDFSDGEEAAIPVLTNRMMVTETQPLPIRGNTTKNFNFKRMSEVSKSSTMKHHRLTLEFTQNPAWYAIQSLPYLMEYPYECTEQIFSRYYANSLASDVANSHPKVKRIFDQWKNIDTEALKSNLSKNQELKYALLEETPWVLAAQDEELQKKNIGVLFDLNRMGNELAKARDKMADRQLSNGGFSWMPGGRDSWYITQYIVEGMGHLDKLGVKDIQKDPKMKAMLTAAVNYIDVELANHYTDLLKWAKRSKDQKAYLAADRLDQMVIHYFYARSFFLDQKISNKTTLEAIKYYESQAIEYWTKKSLYTQGLLALGLHRSSKAAGAKTSQELLEIPMKIVKSAKERALNNEEMGMYWKYPSGYYWYQLPIETHALMIEVFDVVAEDKKAVEDLKVWLLKAKQTTHWKTTKATAAACYSLLMTGDNWLLEDKDIEITLGGKKLDQSKIKKEAGTGYFKTTWEAAEIDSKMANIKIKNPNNVVAWGAMYWQYFEELDKITHFKETPLKLNKKLFKEINSDKGPVLKPIVGQTLEPGDKIKVRIELTVDRDMEYVHMKDMRAAGLEPINVFSQYKYQGGLGYYESTRDASTNFFFGYLSKGTYVFEYPLRVNHKGDFSNGITTIQCMYAPEFTAHSEGVRINVE